jgi:crotonobetainyl-CoA:carnitine CoA-transferase CaiB-like acyl-CoA transferase
MTMTGLLEGVTVLDVGFMVAGPGTAKILGDLGATVLKVEPLLGDVARRLLMVGDVSVMFETFNRGKRSIALDLRSEQGRSVLSDLIGVSDLIVTNLRPKFLDLAGLDWESVHKRNPKASFAVVSTFGLDDPESGITGGDIVAQAESGIVSVNGEPDGDPLAAQNSPADVATATYTATALLAAYIEATRTGVGRMIDVSLTDVYTTFDVGIMPFTLATQGRVKTGRTGRFHPNFTPHGIFRSRHGHVVISAYGSGANSMWPRFAHAIGRDDLADRDGYRSDVERGERRDEIVAIIERWLATFDSDDAAVQILRDNNVIAARVKTPQDVISSDRARRRKLIERVELPSGGMDVVGLPVRIGGYEPRIAPSPPLGADTISVLRDLLGYDDEQVDALIERSVIYAAPEGPRPHVDD